MDSQLQIILEKMEEMKLDLKKQTQELAENLNKSLLQTIEKKLSPLVEDNKKLKQDLQASHARIQNLEREMRKDNIILHGMAENEHSTSELWKNVLEVLNETSLRSDGMREWDQWEISNMRRLGKKMNDKKRPILITLALNWRKYELLKNNKNFPTNIHATEDYPKEIIQIRKELRQRKEQEEKNGKIAFIRYNKLIVKEKAPLETKRKRSPTESPSATDNQKNSKPEALKKSTIHNTNTIPTGKQKEPTDNNTLFENNYLPNPAGPRGELDQNPPTLNQQQQQHNKENITQTLPKQNVITKIPTSRYTRIYIATLNVLTLRSDESLSELSIDKSQ
ncbi:unnamed protein product [Pieris macdunnoughi]|uniref:Uncharacterized protein n=1 Tax=Pieris macdunnoughi TaxID=345717 RepID=A0A821QBA3_9NEOP|nr:unnamed protein product [Pieris macdunnoughi]